MSDPVIVGVDGSASSLTAVDVAAREAHLRGTSLRIVHAIGSPSAHLPPGAAPWSPADHGLEAMVHGLPPAPKSGRTRSRRASRSLARW